MESRSRGDGGGIAQIGSILVRRHELPMQQQRGCDENHGSWMRRSSSSDEMQQQLECSMCGDVGFADQLQHCSACRSRIQHTYCCTSMEGADSGSWICDWCRVAKKGHQSTSKKERRMEIKSESFKEPGFSATSNKDHALELLLKAALTPPDKSELASPQPRLSDPMQGSPVTDCGSNCSSSLESEKLMSLDVGSHSCSAAAEASSSCENRMVLDMNTSDEEGSLGIIPRVHRNRLSTCDIKRSPNSLRCSVQARSLKKLVKQKSLPGSRNHVSSSIPVPSKRLSSLKSMPHTKSVAIIDSPKGLVRRYKSLSDISY
ncbi:hypothetical protein CY35_07G061000 [Sphagnum magellanicum]|uniref:Uncharacterized protein n=1 Tax=Sphagnum magellanicum TaxID=128215 RepID=A0ACB8HL86_9BRYO|nr:hypothetical protein CY35_07G061000 [Sphagnum magellanicum]